MTNPCDRVRPPKVPQTEMTVLTWDESTALAEAHSERYRTLIYLAVDAGTRWSELVGLRRRSVDAVRRKIRVVEQFVQLNDGSRVRRPPTIDSGTRTVTVSASVAAMLADHLDRFVEAASDALVFTNGAGQPLLHSSFLTHHFRKAQLGARVSCRFHDLRHTSVALAIADGGAHPKAIQVRMGHSRSQSPSTATDTSSPSSTRRSPPPSAPASERCVPASEQTKC